MPTLIDTHAHLEMPDFSGDLDAVLERARQAGVRQIITIGTDLNTSRRAVELAHRYPMVFAAVGVHPHDAKTVSDETIAGLADLAQSEQVVAFGETGLDYYRDRSPRAAQREAFIRHLDLAESIGLPIIIHCRDAHADLLAILREHAAAGCRGVCHCFSGSEADAKAFLDLGLHVSFTGTITFPNASAVRAVVKAVPLDRTMVETDCPYLSPQPRRGRRNEPAHVTFIAEQIARLHGVSLDAVAEATTSAAQRLFALPDLADNEGAGSPP